LAQSGNIHKRILIDGKIRLNSHYVWYQNTGYWPDFENKQEVIHHIDGDPLNDDFANLQLMTSSEHTSLHKSGENNHMYGVEFTERRRRELMGENNPNWRGDTASIVTRYQRHLRNPDRYPPLTEDERQEYNAYIRERRRKKRSQQR
jgi:hypothetical protein